jgi:uncharacterized membrane protein
MSQVSECCQSCKSCWEGFKKCTTWIRSKTNARVILVLNLIAIAMMIVCIVYRFIGFTPGVSFFFCMLTIYLALFIILFVLILFKVALFAKYFNFLNSYIGKGMFIIFLTLLILERKTALEIILGICLLIIAIINLVVGCGSIPESEKEQQ